MTGISSLSSASGLAVITAAAQSQAANSSVGSQGSSSDSPSQPQPATSGSSDYTGVFSASYAGVTESMVNHQIKQSEGSYAPAVASEVQGMMDTMVQNYALTSQQISDTLYSGGGLPQVGAPAMTDTFAGQVSNLQTISKAMLKETADQTQWLAAGTLVQNTLDSNGNSIFQSMSSTQFQNFEASVTKSADELAQTASEVSTAFNNGTLSIEKATDVNGLNYSETDTWNVNGGTMSTGGSSVTSNYSLFDPSADGTQHTGLNVGGVELYLSWNEPASAST